MFCKKCGARIDDDSVFCDSCGERVVRRSGGAIERSYQAQPAAVPATDKQRLIEYLEIVVDLEKNRYIQEQTINQLDAEINSLGNRRNITRRFADVQGNAECAERKIDLFGVGGFLGFGAAALIFFTGLSSYTSFGNFILRTIIAIVVGFALLIIPQAIGEAIARLSSKSQSADEQARYDAQYEAAVASDNIRVSRELVKKANPDRAARSSIFSA